MFQSLFYWNLLSYPCLQFSVAVGSLQFQSLFYWNLLSYYLPASSPALQSRFQSLFYWNLLSYSIAQRFSVGKNLVSILVLLEPPLIQFSAELLKQRIRVSILVLLEPPLIQKSRRSRPVIFSVSILVLLEPPLILVIIRTFNYRTSVSILVLLEPPLIQLSALSLKKTSNRFQSLFYWNLLSYTFFLRP